MRDRDSEGIDHLTQACASATPLPKSCGKSKRAIAASVAELDRTVRVEAFLHLACAGADGLAYRVIRA